MGLSPLTRTFENIQGTSLSHKRIAWHIESNLSHHHRRRRRHRPAVRGGGWRLTLAVIFISVVAGDAGNHDRWPAENSEIFTFLTEKYLWAANRVFRGFVRDSESSSCSSL